MLTQKERLHIAKGSHQTSPNHLRGQPPQPPTPPTPAHRRQKRRRLPTPHHYAGYATLVDGWHVAAKPLNSYTKAPTHQWNLITINGFRFGKYLYSGPWLKQFLKWPKRFLNRWTFQDCDLAQQHFEAFSIGNYRCLGQDGGVSLRKGNVVKLRVGSSNRLVQLVPLRSYVRLAIFHKLPMLFIRFICVSCVCVHGPVVHLFSTSPTSRQNYAIMDRATDADRLACVIGNCFFTLAMLATFSCIMLSSGHLLKSSNLDML